MTRFNNKQNEKIINHTNRPNDTCHNIVQGGQEYRRRRI